MTRSRPVIGVSAYAARATWGVWDVEACLLPQTYVDSVVDGGGVPVVLPPVPGLIDLALARLDALIVAGGPDVDPARYGADAGPDTQPPNRARDDAETELLAAAAGLGLPVLGICRGMQLMNVARGGTLVQHLPDVVGTDLHCPAPGRYARHDVRVVPGSRLAGALGLDPGAGGGGDPGEGRDVGRDVGEDVAVPTYHHQAIDGIGSGLVATAWAPDGVVEAIEDPSLPFWLGVQWHPEAGEDRSLFAALVRAAIERDSGACAGSPSPVAR